MNGVTATAYLRGDSILFELESDKPMYQDVCSPTYELQKRMGDGWVPVRDERPDGFHDGYYLDDIYVPPTFGLGCDVTTCQMMDGTAYGGTAVEVVAAGTREPPAGTVSEHLANPAPVFEREPISGLLRVQLFYSTTSNCSDQQNISIEIEVPEQGVCCPVGPAGCGSEGPAGGWAPSLEQCSDTQGAPNALAEAINDTRGCPALRFVWPEGGNAFTSSCAP